jgi:hypothetical protein
MIFERRNKFEIKKNTEDFKSADGLIVVLCIIS